ncbi:hypothetical protein P3W45_000070 [Vairimorpha bombi]|jgi:DNA mismatch repair protein PMS2
MIKKLSSDISELIKSQQYINNTYTITKELLENSLDSGASTIKIIIDDDLIRVDDNGSGIKDLNEVGKAGFTSKENTTYYVLGLNTDSSNLYCGYRGLALCSIKNMCTLEIITKHGDNDFAYKKSFSDNKIVQSARERGTTINVSKIFENCPMRRELTKKNLSKDVKKIASLIESYSMVYNINFLFKFRGKVLFNKTGYSSLLGYCKSTYHDRFEDSLCKNTNEFFLFMIPNSESKDLSKIFFGKRYVVSKKITKEIKNAFNLYQEGYPTFVLELKGALDFNISPDKSEILFDNEKEIIEKLKETIKEYFSNQIYCINKSKETVPELNKTSGVHTEKAFSNISESALNIENIIEESEYQSLIEKCINEDVNLKYDVSDTFKQSLIEDASIVITESQENIPSKNELDSQLVDFQNTYEDTKKRDLNQSRNLFSNSPIFKRFCSSEKLKDEEFKVQDTEIVDLTDQRCDKKNQILDSPISEIRTPMKLSETVFDYIKTSSSHEVSLTILKSDFYNIKVIGQFNKGFILTTLIKNNRKYLLIVDQHASDEIYNYETLKSTTKIIKQKLVAPYDLKLSPIDESFVQENLSLFSKYGYEVKDNKLITIPVIKGQEFGIKEFQDLLDNIKNEEEGLDKIHKIMATKACRMSVMIGEHLQKSRLEKIVKNLGTLDRPWKCPHGRPTFMIIEEIIW